MKKNIALLLFTALIIAGCGGTTDSSDNSNTNDKNDKSGNIKGAYNLWEYMVPSSDITNSFIETKAGVTNSYKTTYTTTGNQVKETSDYAPNEQTIYVKKSDRISITFEKQDESSNIFTTNGSYDLHLTANIGDTVTIKDSTCKLKAHYDNKTINNKINCDGKPGYYQKGVGEVAQLDTVDIKSSKRITTLSN